MRSERAPSLRVRIVLAALRRAGPLRRWYRFRGVEMGRLPYALVSLRGGIVVSAPVVSRRAGPAQWRGAGWLAGGSIIGPSPFWFFLGQCQKEQTPLTHHKPITILSPPILLLPSTLPPITIAPSPTLSASNTPIRYSHMKTTPSAHRYLPVSTIQLLAVAPSTYLPLLCGLCAAEAPLRKTGVKPLPEILSSRGGCPLRPQASICVCPAPSN
ncbi:MAG: N-acetylmuramoyl-L-alanine amidase [uncultured Cytophagales bacterium]|uniref:N-acetylmuramoyl-L-alanine amidase n=1 Tax=uncultured Cytophagales bacterium TaxID=158755 RepID=A0A6J4K251_9SPHI|nr:MAG: N-acetylmuramoyl-L-alanine amidase [uncultured Cytophagales bacterium]